MCGRLAAQVIADRARKSAGALWPGLQRATAIDPDSGNAPSYFLVFVGAVFPVFVNAFAAVRGLDRTQVNAALCLGAGSRLPLTDVVIPASLPIIFPGLRIALGVGWMCVVAAELIAAQSGLGYLIQQSRLLLQTQNVLTGMIAIGIIGFAMNAGMLWLERRLIPWRAAGARS